jgi:hypothetical protein
LVGTAGKGGYYFTFDIMIKDKAGRVMYTGEFIAREDSGCTKFCLSWDMYLLSGEPSAQQASGNGFNCVIQHLKLKNKDLQFSYKVHGLDMEWQQFEPIFLAAPNAEATNDLANLSTWGWKPQAALANQNIGVVGVGIEKFIVGSAEAGVDVMRKFLK